MSDRDKGQRSEERDLMAEHASAFDALDRTPEEREQLRLRAAAMRILRFHIRGQGWSREQAAERLGMELTQVSDLMRGKVSSFPAGKLAETLDAAVREQG